MIHRPKFYRDKPFKFEGLDLESTGGRGDPVVICSTRKPSKYFPNPVLKLFYINDKSEIIWLINALSLSEWLFHSLPDGSCGVLFNARYDGDGIGKLLLLLSNHLTPQERIKQIRHFKQTGRIIVGRYIFKSFGKKGFVITKKREKKKDSTETKNFYDIYQFFKVEGERNDLDSVARREFPDDESLRKTRLFSDGSEINRQKIGEDWNYYKKYESEIIAYMQQDALLTKRLAEKWQQDFTKTMESLVARGMFDRVIYPKRLLSHASLSKMWLEYKHPTIYNSMLQFSETLQRLAWDCFKGGITFTRVVGKINRPIVSWDARSMYPWSMYDNIYKVSNLEERYVVGEASKDAIYGCYVVMAPFYKDLPDGFMTNHSTYRFTDSKGVKYKRPMTKLEIDTYRKYKGKNSVEVLYGIELVPKTGHTPEKEFDDIVELYRIKEEEKMLAKQATNPEEKAIHLKNSKNIKLILNSGYGVTAQNKKSVSGFTNLIIAAYITAGARVYLWDLIQAIGYENFIAAYTDSLFVFAGEIDEIIAEVFGNKDWFPTFNSELIEPYIGENIGMLEPKEAIDAALFIKNGIYVLWHRCNQCNSQNPDCPKCHGQRWVEFKHRGHPSLKLDQVLQAKGDKIELHDYDEPNTLKECVAKCNICEEDCPYPCTKHDSLETLLEKIGRTNKFEECSNHVSLEDIQTHLEFPEPLTFEKLNQKCYIGKMRYTDDFWYNENKEYRDLRPVPKNLMQRYFRLQRQRTKQLEGKNPANASLESAGIPRSKSFNPTK